MATTEGSSSLADPVKTVAAPGTAAGDQPAARPLVKSNDLEVDVGKTILFPILLIALTDVALQLDNALAISSVASGVPPGQRFLVLGVGVLLAAACLFGFTLLGSTFIERLTWLKPVAGIALLFIGGQLIWSWFRS